MADIRHPTVPIEYAGKWIAWDHAMTRIVASGAAPIEVLKAAKNAGENGPILRARCPVVSSGRGGAGKRDAFPAEKS